MPLFDEIIVAIGDNSAKGRFFPIQQRKAWIEAIFRQDAKVRIEIYNGLTVDFCKKQNASYILRGLRTAADFEYERAIGQVNRAMNTEIESVFLLTTPELSSVTSTIVREIIRHGGDASKFLPDAIKIEPGKWTKNNPEN